MPNTRTTKYIYHSEKTKTTCENCKKHDNEVYYDIKDIPKLPIHPNCKCWIETVELSVNKDTKCDCKDRFLVLENNLNNSIENIDSMLKSIDDNILDIEEEINDENEENTKDEIISKFYLIKNKIDSFKKECENLLTDIEITKEYKYDSTYHTIDECYSNKELKEHSKNVSRVCSKLDSLSEELKEIKEEKKNIIKELKNTNKEEQKNLEKELEELKKGTMTGGAPAIGLDTEERQDLYDDIIKEFKNRDTHKTFVDIIKDFGKDRLEKMNAAEIQERIESTIGDEYNMFSNYLVQNFSGQDTAGMLDLAHGEDKMNYKNYIKDAIKIQDWDDKLVSTDKDYWNKKLTEQFKRDGYDINKIPGYFFKSNSEPSQRLKNNNDLKNMLKRHKYEILKGTDFSDGFPQYGNDLISKMQKGNNFKNAFGKVDFKHPYIDRHGNLHVIMCDTYDFNNEDNILIQAGRNQMKKGNIKPFFTIHEIIISKNEADKILR